MGREAGVGRGRAADLGDVDGPAGEGGEDEALGEAAVAGEAQELWLRFRHGGGWWFVDEEGLRAPVNDGLNQSVGLFETWSGCRRAESTGAMESAVLWIG